MASTSIAQNMNVGNNLHIHNGAQVGIFGNLHNHTDTLYNNGHISMFGDSLANTVPFYGKGALEMIGSNEQHITHSAPLTVDSLLLNNTNNISYDNNITINAYATFTNGILYDIYNNTVLPPNLPFVMFGSNGTINVNEVRDESHVEGLVKKQGTSDFVFPIGDYGFYRPIIANTITSDTIISAKYYFQDIAYPQEKLGDDTDLFRNEFWYVSGNETNYNLALTHHNNTSVFDPYTKDLSIIIFDSLRQQNHAFVGINDIRNTFSQTALFANSSQLNNKFIWYAFAKTNKQINDIIIPQILTPNGDGNNDFFTIPNIQNFDNNHIRIINRYGGLVYMKKQYDNSWDGRPNQQVIGSTDSGYLPTGTYFVFFYQDRKLIYKDFIELRY